MSTTVRDRLGAVTGAAFVVLILVGNQMATAGSGQSAHPTGDQVLRDAAHQVSSASLPPSPAPRMTVSGSSGLISRSAAATPAKTFTVTGPSC